MRFWFKRKDKNASPATTLTREPEDKVILHGHDLDKWNYLGYTHCHYMDENGKIIGEYPIFLFAHKNNDKRRSYCIPNDAAGYVEKNHRYVIKTVKPWAAGEGKVYGIISGKTNKPSDYLKEYMLEHYNAEWNTDTNWWGTSDKAKHNSAQNKQKREQKAKEDKPEVKVDNNVVTVEFGKQA
jgi:hypothetical protein